MVYAVLGIPLCLVVLSRIGKTLTRAIKFIWAYVRRFYYTGSCSRARSMVPTTRLHLSLVQRITDSLKIRKAKKKKKSMVVIAAEMEELYVPYEIDDKFNLPPIVAIAIAFLYILAGAIMYTRWENWDYLVAFYFTFVSLSTVGFGDIVPEHPNFFLATSIYLILGMALLAMVINVVMESVISVTIDMAHEQVLNIGQRIITVGEEEGEERLPLSSTEMLAEARKARELRRKSV